MENENAGFPGHPNTRKHFCVNCGATMIYDNDKCYYRCVICGNIKTW